MKKDWSVIRITILLYFIVILLPLNYYYTKQSFKSMQNDASTMNNLVEISGALQTLTAINIKEIDDSLETIEKKFINYPPNKEYVDMFHADKFYTLLVKNYEKLKLEMNDEALTKVNSFKTFTQVNNFSNITKEMMSYKMTIILDRLYLSLAFTMIIIVALIFFIRLYIKIQIKKHAIHDHVTGLYNKKYFDNALLKIELLETRQGNELSLLVLSIDNYSELEDSLNKKGFEKRLVGFSTIFNNFFRRSDIVCRIEENCFVAITPDATLTNANKLSDRLLQELNAECLNDSIKIDVRVGVAKYDKDDPLSLLGDAKLNMKSHEVFSIGKTS